MRARSRLRACRHIRGGNEARRCRRQESGPCPDQRRRRGPGSRKLGARAARVELQQGLQKEDATNREIARSSLEDVDVTQAYVDLQKQMTALQATQASFSKLTNLSLFDYLR